MIGEARGPSGALSLVAVISLLQGCTSASFVPLGVRRGGVPGSSVRLERARLGTNGSLRVSTRFETAAGATVYDARVVPARDPACANGGPLAHAGEFRQQGALRWERPLTVRDGSTLELGFSDYDRAFDSPSVLELDVGSGAGTACLRLPLSGPGVALAWQPVSAAPALGLRAYLDDQSASVLARAGLLTRSFRHTVELGLGGSHNELLATGPVLAFGVGSERILWSADVGVFSASAEIGYQARLAFEAPATGRARLIHGPRIGVRPMVFTAGNPELLHIGPRFGSLSLMEIFLAYWMSPGGGPHSGNVGFAFTWETPLPH